VPSDASVEAVDEELSLFLDLIRQTDGAVQDPPATRHANSKPPVNTSDPGWQHFYKMVKGKKVKATMVIDFQYKFNETVERMYCFDDGGADRVVLHVHTLEQWPGTTGESNEARFLKALAGNPATRARTVTSVNIRYATLNPDFGRYDSNGRYDERKFLQDNRGFNVVEVHNWKSLVSKDRGGETEWSWGWHPPLKIGDVPQCQRDMKAEWKDGYDEVHSEASLSACLFTNPLESDSTTGSARHS